MRSTHNAGCGAVGMGSVGSYVWSAAASKPAPFPGCLVVFGNSLILSAHCLFSAGFWINSVLFLCQIAITPASGSSLHLKGEHVVSTNHMPCNLTLAAACANTVCCPSLLHTRTLPQHAQLSTVDTSRLLRLIRSFFPCAAGEGAV
jgi:hypothetical protein